MWWTRAGSPGSCSHLVGDLSCLPLCCLSLSVLTYIRWSLISPAAIREFILKKNCLGLAGAAGDKLFFTRTSTSTSATSTAGTDKGPDCSGGGESVSEEFLLGVVVGLACYNGVLVSLPLVDIVYKLLNGGQVSREETCQVRSACSGDQDIITGF